VKATLALMLSRLLVAALAVPALADDPLGDLSNLAAQEQASPHIQGNTAATAMTDLTALPGTAEVQAEIDAQAGAAESDRITAYLSTLQGQLQSQPGNVDLQAKLGIALVLGGNMAQARTALEAALAQAPGAQSLYGDLATSISSVDPGIKVYVNGRQTPFDVLPVIVSGRTLVPIRAVAEQLGAQVGWDPATFTATITLGAQIVQVTKDSTTALVNGQPVALDVAATITDGRTLLPLRFVSESLGEQVDWHPGSGGSAVISIVDK